MSRFADRAGIARLRRFASAFRLLPTGKPGEQVRCLISVGMLSEGWDARNVTQILGLRRFSRSCSASPECPVDCRASDGTLAWSDSFTLTVTAPAISVSLDSTTIARQ